VVDIEKAAADEFSLDHRVQGRSRLEEKSGADFSWQNHSKQGDEQRPLERSHPDRCSEVIVIPSNI
tara:strand:- start:355 stop:552 length:198 start_codon:yes stop_codon:yes gene_type:complete